MRDVMRNTTDKKMRGVISCHSVCPHCGRKLNRREVTLFGKTRTVTDYGSCGCEASKWDGVPIPRNERKYASAGIPARYLKAECVTNGWEESIADGRSLYIYGPYGAGKTYFACTLAKKLIDMGIVARFENSKHILTELQGMYEGRKSDALERAYSCRVLVLDDIGKEQPTAYSISMLYELIDSRYMAGKPNIVTSNFTKGELLARWASADAATAESIVSRLCDGADSMRMDGADRRLA